MPLMLRLPLLPLLLMVPSVAIVVEVVDVLEPDVELQLCYFSLPLLSSEIEPGVATIRCRVGIKGTVTTDQGNFEPK